MLVSQCESSEREWSRVDPSGIKYHTVKPPYKDIYSVIISISLNGFSKGAELAIFLFSCNMGNL